MKILVTGGDGYIGSAIVNCLLKSGHDVYVIDILMYNKDYFKKVYFQRADVSDSKFMKKFLNIHKFDTIIHMAGIVGDEACRIHRKDNQKTNIDSVKIISDHFDGLLIFPSSCSVYGSNKSIVNENSKLNPLSIYAESKVAAETILKNRPSTIIYRFGTLHGLSDRFRNDLVVNTLTLKALAHEKIPIYGGNQWRPLVHVQDVASTICANLKKVYSGIYNLSSINSRIIDVANAIKEILPKTQICIKEIPFQDKRDYRVSTKRIKKTMLCFDKYSINDTILSIEQLYNEGRIKNISDIYYSNLGRLEFKI